MLARTRLASAIRALRVELAGGPNADLGSDVRELQKLLAAREQRERVSPREAPELELLAALPDAAALIARDGAVRLANAAFDSLAPETRAAGRMPFEVTGSAELTEGIARAQQGTGTKLAVEVQRRTYQAHLVPLLRGEVLLLLRDVTDVEQALATRRDFVANASHELRTPISAITVAAETLRGGALVDPDRVRAVVDLIARNAARLARLTQDLLDLSRLESRQWRPAPSALPLRPVVEQVLSLLAPAALAKSLELQQAIPDEAVVRADPRGLEQALVNLLDNAIKYTPAGSVRVSAEREELEWVVSVRDTGPGIAPQHLSRLFERFYRVDPRVSRERGGTGLGLAITRHLVQGMGGSVGVESGSWGSRFWVRLAAARP